ncbi:MmgE/PrpD family protein [Castellaniella sp.]|uniref:MmgE/PrpD family protein n=1 Tax=Castellaniella sp. TaxID=1955812 RepID=UPI00355DFC78
MSTRLGKNGTDVTAALARFASELALEHVPEVVRARARALILDSLGVGMRAWWDAESTGAHVAALQALGQATASSPEGGYVLGAAQRFAPPAAAELNGALIHSLDFDDTYARGALHPSATVLPAALAAAGMVQASGARVLAAVIAGYELVCRLSVALGAADHYDRGFHPTATCGVFAASVAAARVLGLDAAQTASALGIALSQAAGSLQFLENGAWTKRFQVGAAARAGLVSACLARAGYKGASHPLEGPHGFMRAYAPHADMPAAQIALGDQWRTLDIAIKPYPACRFAHAAIDAIVALRSAHDLAGAEIGHIECALPHKGILLVGAPIEQKRQVRSVVEGQFSMPFLAAVAVLDGQVTWDTYGQRLGDPHVDALMQKVDVISTPAIEALFPDRFGAQVRIRLASGQVLEHRVDSPSGEPDNFPSMAALHDKFSGLVGGLYSSDAIQGLLHDVQHLEHRPGVDSLFISPKSA